MIKFPMKYNNTTTTRTHYYCIIGPSRFIIDRRSAVGDEHIIPVRNVVNTTYYHSAMHQPVTPVVKPWMTIIATTNSYRRPAQYCLVLLVLLSIGRIISPLKAIMINHNALFYSDDHYESISELSTRIFNSIMVLDICIPFATTSEHYSGTTAAHIVSS